MTKMSMKKISIFLSLVMIMSFADSAFAAEGSPMKVEESAGSSNKADVVVTISSECGESLTWKVSGETLTISGTGAMYDFTEESKAPWYFEEVRRVVIGKEVTSIGNYAFIDCSKLTSVTIPKGVVSIADSAFEDTALTSITLPDTIKTIGERAFAQSNLSYLTIPKNVTSIGNECFADCRKLSSMTLPESVTTLGDAAFKKCINLRSITVKNPTMTLNYRSPETLGVLHRTRIFGYYRSTAMLYAYNYGYAFSALYGYYYWPYWDSEWDSYCWWYPGTWIDDDYDYPCWDYWR